MISLTTSLEGLHRVTDASLAALLGETAETTRGRIRQRQFALTCGGEPIDYFTGDGASNLVFYASLRQNNYTDTNVFWLTCSSNAAALGQVDGGAPLPATNIAWLSSLHREQDLLCRYEVGQNPDSNYWFWTELVGSHPFLSKFSDTCTVQDLAKSNLVARLTINVQGRTLENHTLKLAVNGVTNAAWQGSWSGQTAASFTFELPSSVLRDGSNTNVFSALGTTDSHWWLDSYTLDYPRLYLARQGQLEFGAGSNAFVTVSGFSASNINVLDVSDFHRLVVVTNCAQQQNGSTWRLSFAPGSPDGQYAAFDPTATLPAPVMRNVVWQGLGSSSNSAGLVIVAHPSLLAAVEPLAERRRQQGLPTKIVSIDTIYDEFNWGFREPEAIRRFLTTAWNQWQRCPAYLLLVGNGTYDYRNRLAKGDNLVPPLMVPTPFGLAGSDTAFGDILPAPGPELAAGRLPVLSPAQLTAVISKIAAYENNLEPGTNTALLVADHPDAAAGDFVTEIQAVRDTLAGVYQQTIIYPTDTTTMHGQIQSNLNRGTDLMCYMGHGATDRLGSSGYLLSSDVASLTNGHRLPFLSAITCLTGFFSQPGYDCLAETLVLSTNAGAIAVLSATALSYDADANSLNLALMDILANQPQGRLGDLVRGAMVRYNQQSFRLTPSAIYGITGDPTLVYRGADASIHPVISGLSQMPDGNFVLTLTAQPAQNYTLRASTNINLPSAQWPVISTGQVPVGPFRFADLGATNFPRRFYRLITTQSK